MEKCYWLVFPMILMVSAANLDIAQSDLGTNARLESLEHRFHQLESLLKAVQLSDKLTDPSSSLVQQSATKANKIYRTCHETRASDPSLPTGMYFIDPDGQDIGDNPIYVHCDMSTGATSIDHDIESKTDVGHCADPGCYSKAIIYSNATLRQMIALSDFSTECHQSIKYDCNYAPFEINGIAYSWWNDRNGTARYFWAGENSGVHTCQCGLNNNCVDSIMKCNCDSLAPVALADDGVITEKNFLPVTRLNFGRTQLSSSSGAHTLGKFVCSGQFIFKGAPSTCADLSLIGHTLSGFYSVKGQTTEQVETIYCNFNKLSTDSGYETRIGFPELKSSPTYFSVKMNTSTSQSNTGTVRFQVEQLNIGGAMNLATGTFTAPRNGTYYFAFSGLAKFGTTSYACYLQLDLVSNYGRTLGSTYFYGTSTTSSLYSTGSIEATAHLSAGEQVSLIIQSSYYASLIEEGNSNYNQFTGWLLREDL